MKIILNVTPKDVHDGMPRDTFRCPIGLALSRFLKRPVTTTHRQWFAWHKVDHGIMVGSGLFPKNIKKFISDFDKKEMPEKRYKFRMEIPDWLMPRES